MPGQRRWAVRQGLWRLHPRLCRRGWRDGRHGSGRRQCRRRDLRRTAVVRRLGRHSGRRWRGLVGRDGRGRRRWRRGRRLLRRFRCHGLRRRSGGRIRRLLGEWGRWLCKVRLGGRGRRLGRCRGGGLGGRGQHLERDGGDRWGRRQGSRVGAEQQQKHRAVQEHRRQQRGRMDPARRYGLAGQPDGAGGHHPGCDRGSSGGGGGPHGASLACLVSSALAREESCSRQARRA